MIDFLVVIDMDNSYYLLYTIRQNKGTFMKYPIEFRYHNESFLVNKWIAYKSGI
jgi:hypothetical protein